MRDINPDFTFDAVEEPAAVQAPWEFQSAMEDARQDLLVNQGTSIDQKIRARLADRSKGKAAGKLQQGRPSKGQKRKPAEPESGSESKEDSRSEDRPLPGEEDEGDTDSEADDEDALVLEESDSEDLGTGSAKRMDAQLNSDNDSEELSEDGGEAEARGSDANQADREGMAHNAAESASEEDKEVDADEAAGAELEQRRVSGAAAGPGPEAACVGASAQVFAEMPKGTRFAADSFAELHLSRPLLKACTALGYKSPTPIQAACIPLALAGRDIAGSAVTGSGKTAAFALPLLERLLLRNRRVAATYALVLTPTRELAVQVHSMTTRLAQFTDVRCALVVGGLSLQVQAATLRSSPEVVIATPGRLIDHLRNTHSMGLEDLQLLVLDEADRLLDMGFADEVQEVLRAAPRQRQTLLFSATMGESVRELARLSLRRPVRLAADATAAVPRALQHEVVRLKGAAAGNKEAVLLALAARALRRGRAIVFFRTKQRAHRAKMLFGLAGLLPAAELHGNLSQAQRLEALERFRTGEAAFLLATDVAARGLDILGVEAVVNYDAPAGLAGYLHRVGRTARAGAAGRALTLAEDADRPLLRELMKRTRAPLANRVLPAAAVAQWAARIEGMALDIARLIEEEREERDLRRAEMEAAKAENLITHEAEIAARPARTWFQTPRDKRAAHAAARAAELGLTNEQKRSKKVADKNGGKAAPKRKRSKDDLEKGRPKRSKVTEDEGLVAGKVRAVKSQEAAFRQQGMSGTRAGRAAIASVAGVGTKKETKGSKKAAKRESVANLFEGDGGVSGGHAKVYAGGGRSGSLKVHSKSMPKSELNRLKRGGKGAKSFKSKARHKRR